MPSKVAPFLLSELIRNVQSSKSVEELLELYSGPQTDENSNICIPALMPILEIRMQDLADKYLALETELQITCKRWVDLTKKSNNIAMQLGSLYSAIYSEDYGSELYQHALEVKTHFEKSNAELKSIFLAIIDHEFNVTQLNLHHYLHTHTKLSELVKADEYEFDFVKRQLSLISKELLVYQESISWLELRSKIHSVLQTLFILVANSLDKKSLIHFINEVIRMKALSPLISDVIVKDAGKLQEDIETFSAAFNASINSIYLSEVKQQGIIEAIIIYQIVLKKLFNHHNN